MATLFDPSRPLNHTIIDTYVDFIEHGIQFVVDQLAPIRIGQHVFTLGACTIHKPGQLETDGEFREITPDEAYVRELDYRSMVRVEVLDSGKPLLRSQLLCFLPLMVGAWFWPHPPVLEDSGGYFIIKGDKKFIMNAENQAPDMPHFIRDGESWRCEVVSSRTMCRLVLHDNLTLTLKHMSPKKVRLIDVLAALGETHPNALELFSRPGDDLRLVQDLCEISKEQEGDCDSLWGAWGESWRQQLSARVLPYLGVSAADDDQKRFWLLRWARQLIECKHGMRPPTDRDHLANKRITTAGALLEEKFARCLRDFWTTCEKDMLTQKELSIELAMTSWSRSITSSIHHMMRTGIVSKDHEGFVKTADRAKTDMAFSSNPRKTNQFMARTGRQYLPRGVHGSHYGFICPAETPSGPSIGFTKTPSQTCEYTVKGDTVYWTARIAACVEPWSAECQRVMLNGRILGRPRGSLEDVFAKLRQDRLGDWHASVSLEQDEVRVDISAGRWVRPVWTARAAAEMPFLAALTLEQALRRGLMRPFHVLVEQGLLEYIDPGTDCVVAPSFGSAFASHIELDASLLLGESAARIPLSNHTPAPRISFYADMAQQAVGMLAGPPLWETSYNALWYGQSMLNPTWATRRNPMTPTTSNVVLMLCTHGQNQEDSLIFNEGSADRGLFRAFSYKVFVDHCGRNCVFGVRKSENEALNRRLKKVENGGLPARGTYIYDGDPVSCRVDTKTGHMYPTYYHGRDRGIVEDVAVSMNMDNQHVAKIKVRFSRPVIAGDKFSSLHGQKGTVGQMQHAEDMPFSARGATPDIIMNTHSIPSRMTIGQNLEMGMGKASAVTGRVGDGTAFRALPDFESALHAGGFVRTGTETMYSGETGEMMHVPIFMGVAAYQRLKHFAMAKIHARPTRGLVSALTRQPRSGRARGGGFRVGQMEGDAMLAHGASMLMHERFFTSSDGRNVYFCATCGSVGWMSPAHGPVCGYSNCPDPQLVLKHTSHTFLLLLNELRAMNILYSIKHV